MTWRPGVRWYLEDRRYLQGLRAYVNDEQWFLSFAMATVEATREQVMYDDG